MLYKSIILISICFWAGITAACAQQNNDLDHLLSLPYLQGYHEVPAKRGVTIDDPSRAYQGLNLYCSGHRSEAGIMDMHGNVLHRWSYEADKIWEGRKLEHQQHWRRVYLYENGDLLVIWDKLGMAKIDKDSNLLWAKRNEAHHYVHVTEDGDIYVLTQQLKPGQVMGREKPFYDNYITVLSSDGEVKKAYSILEAFQNSPYRSFLKKTKSGLSDVFHTNTIQLLDGSCAHISPLFKKGNVLIAIRHMDTLAIIDLDKNEVVWARDGKEGDLWRLMHEPALLPNGRILLFDNMGGRGKYGRSRVIEYDLLSDQIVWKYEGNQHHPFETVTCGTNQRLPNGNTLITETEKGRAFEVTREGEIVWEYYNTYRTGAKSSLIASLFQLDRLEPEQVKWLRTQE